MDIPNRDELERKYGKLLARLLAAYGGRLLEKLGDPPNLSNIPADFWDGEAKELLNALAPFGEQVYIDAAQRIMDESPSLGVDWALINEAAVEFAQQYTFDLVRGIQDTDRRMLQRAVSRYFEQSQTRQQLEDVILRNFSPVRAEMIAVTEITRAAAQGEMGVSDELRKQGIEMVERWQTSNDEIVCPICSPLNGKKRGDGWSDPPPAHPRCRCFVSLELPKVRR